MADEPITDVAVPEDTQVIPAYTRHPRVKFNPEAAIKIDDKIRVIIQRKQATDQDFVEIKKWTYDPNDATFPPAGRKLNFSCDLRIEEVTDTDAE